RSTAASASLRNRAVPSPSGALAKLPAGPGGHPAVEPLGGVADRALLAVAGQHPGPRRQVEKPLDDRGELGGEVRENPRVRHRAVPGKRVTGEHDPEVLAVEADRARRVAPRVDDLKLDVRD